jgi:hypothetical protein
MPLGTCLSLDGFTCLFCAAWDKDGLLAALAGEAGLYAHLHSRNEKDLGLNSRNAIDVLYKKHGMCRMEHQVILFGY